MGHLSFPPRMEKEGAYRRKKMDCWLWPKNDRGPSLPLPAPGPENNTEALSGSDAEMPSPCTSFSPWLKEVPGGNIFSLTNESLGPRTGGIKGALL